MSIKYFFNLRSTKPLVNNEAGSYTLITSNEVSGFENISFASLQLNKDSSTEPIWHTNTNKIGYCLEGEILVTMRSPKKAESFTVGKGDIFFIPKGYIHHMETIGDSPCIINFAFNNHAPETMFLSKAIYSISENVFNSTFDTSEQYVNGLKRIKSNSFLKKLSKKTKHKKSKTNRFKFAIEASQKTILTQGGYLQIGTKTNLPSLEGLGVLGFGLNPKGIVEPHWHTNAGELVYIVKGKTRITLLSPEGPIQIMNVGAGQGAFAPASHFHSIENVGEEDVEVIAFFNNEEPDYIGIGEVMGSYSDELLASVFNTTPEYFEEWKKPKGPLVIVPI